MSANPKNKIKRPYRPPRKLLEWEKKLPKAPDTYEVIREVILSKISFFQPKIFNVIFAEVLDDYGITTDRTVYRHLKWFIGQGLVKRVTYDEDPCYLRVGSWKSEPECQTAVEDETHAA